MEGLGLVFRVRDGCEGLDIGIGFFFDGCGRSGIGVRG